MDKQDRLKRKYKRLSPAEWASLEALYATGGATLSELSEEYAVSVRSIQLHLSKSGTKKGEAHLPIREEAKARIIARAMPQAETLADRIRATKDAAYADALGLQDFIRETLAEARSSATGLSLPARMRLADQAAHSLDRVHRLQRAVLGMDREAQLFEIELPELPIRILTDEEAREIRAKQEAEDNELWEEASTEQTNHETEGFEEIIEEE